MFSGTPRPREAASNGSTFNVHRAFALLVVPYLSLTEKLCKLLVARSKIPMVHCGLSLHAFKVRKHCS